MIFCRLLTLPLSSAKILDSGSWRVGFYCGIAATNAVSIISFLQEARAEFKRVTWPSRSRTIKLTTTVLTITAAAALFIALLDYLFGRVVEILLGR